MEQYINKLRKILEYLNDPLTANHSGDKSICYLTYPLEMVLEMKFGFETLMSVIRHYDYDFEVLSLGNLVHEFLRNYPRRSNWKLFDNPETKREMTSLFNNVGNTVKTSGIMEKTILEKQEKLLSKSKPLLILTDLEGVHPFARFGPIETLIYNDIKISIIVFYPGEMNGSSLQFLGFYPPDGNYRSKHF